MKSPVIAAILIVVLGVVAFFVFLLLADARVGASPPSLTSKGPTNQMNIMWLAFLANLVVCFVIVKVIPLDRTWSLRASVGVALVGFIVLLAVVATRGLAEYVNVPLTWGGFGALGCGIGCGSSALFKRG